jgi:glycosyltransferase involved in cell wall biosynthesis
MKILQVLFSGLGGHGSVAFSLVRGDRQRAHNHHMIFYGIEPLAPGYGQACADLGIGSDVVLKQPGLDLGSWRQFLAVLKRSRPDVVVLHSTSLVAAAASYARMTGTPLIVVDHLSNQVKQPRDWRFVALALALADHTVFLTDDFAREVKNRLGRLYSPRRVQVIGNGIDVEAFALPAARPPAPAAIQVGMNARFSASKDHLTLIRAIAQLRDNPRSGARPVRLTLAGAGETLAQAQTLARDLGLEALVDFPGVLPESALPAQLGSLDIYAQCSFGETMSTAVMQAMAAGLPVVASDVPGLRNMIRVEETGVLVPVANAAALTSALADLAGDAAKRARLGRGAQEHARRQWSNETMFKAYEALMFELRSRHQARSSWGRQLKRVTEFFRSRD